MDESTPEHHVAPEQSGSKWDILAITFALFLPTIVTLAYFVLADQFSAVVQQTTYTVSKTFQFLFPIIWVVCVQGWNPRYGYLPLKGTGWGLSFGALVAIAMGWLYQAVLKSAPFFEAATGPIRDKIAGLSIDQAWIFLGVGVFYSLVHSFLEEYYWRWFVFGQLRKLVSVKSAIMVSSLGFMLHHVLVIGTYFGYFSLATWLFSLCVAIGGAVWAWLYQRSDSLLGPWLSHLLVDAAIFAIGYDIARELFAK